jgi:endosialidase-like protein
MSLSNPPLFWTTKFNDSAFEFTNYLTKSQADQYYIGIVYLPANIGTASGGKIMITDASNSIQGINQIGFTTMNYGGTIVTTTGIELNYLHGVTPGTTLASIAVVMDSSNNIQGINSLTSTTLISTTLNITGTSASTSNITGALTLTGGIGIAKTTDASSSTNGGSFTSAGGGAFAKSLYVGTNGNITGNLNVSSVTNSTSYTTGALIINGGVGIASNVFTDGNLTITGTLSGVTTLTATNLSGTITTVAQTNITSLGTLTGLTISGIFSSTNSTVSTSSTTGALVITGGVGIGGNIFTGGNLTITGTLSTSNLTISSTTNSTSSSTGALVISGGIGIAKDIYTSGNLTITGAVAGVTTIGASGIVTLSNSTASTTTGTGALVITGGVGIGGAITSGSSLTISGALSGVTTLGASGIVTLSNSTASTTTGTGALVITGGLGIAGAITSGGTINSSGVITLTNTNSSLTASSNSVILSGGISIAKNILLAGFQSFNLQYTGASHLALQRAISLYDNQLLFRGQAGSDMTHGCMYSGNGNTNWNSGGGFANLSVDGPVLYGNSSVLIGNIAGGTLETGCALFSGTTSYFYGTCRVSGVSAPSSGAGLELSYGSSISNIYSYNRSSSTYLDLNLNDKITISASNGQLSGIAGIHASGASNSGDGANMTYNGNANFYGYKTSTGSYTPTILGNGNIIITALGNVQINQTIASSSFPCEIGYTSQQLTTSYGFLKSTGSTGTASSSGYQNYSLYCNGRIACGSEIDCFSDERLKENIRNITENESIAFVKNVIPKYYNLKEHKDHSFGYLAQDVCKAELAHADGLKSLITIHSVGNLKETTDADGFVSPAGHTLAINYSKICCLLHKFILIQDEKIEKNKDEINLLNTKIKLLMLDLHPDSVV